MNTSNERGKLIMRYEINIAETYLNWARLTCNYYNMSKAMMKLDAAINELAGIHYDDNLSWEIIEEDY